MPCSLEIKIIAFATMQLQTVETDTCLHYHNIQIQSKLLQQSTEFGRKEYSNLLFTKIGSLCSTNMNLWKAIIRGYAYNGPFEKCISMYMMKCLTEDSKPIILHTHMS
ncbi:unnamed protein product [Ilex paraguariensis]|uniref:Uncharacterized protein n=1 Tax=Ilex paraguariensis TaxID=185542 RepID=A0ABC8SV74_9AQUA